MSLKQGQKTRSSISRYLFALLRPFMSDPPPPGLPDLRFHSPRRKFIVMGVVDWNLQISQYLDDDGDNSYTKCSLHYVEYCKCSHGTEHEFLVFYFGHWSSSAVGVICSDRTVFTNQDNSSSSGQSSGIASPPSSGNVAHDNVSIIGSPRHAALYLTQTYGPFKTLCRLSFTSSSRPSSLQVSTILSLVNDVSLLYKQFNCQYYWYTDTVWRSLKRIFPENKELCYNHDACSRYVPSLLGLSDESVDVVCNRYDSAWDITLQQWTQARDRRAALREQFQEEGRKIGQEEGRKIGREEGRKQAPEEGRKQAPEEGRAEELERQIEEIQAKLKQLEVVLKGRTD